MNTTPQQDKEFGTRLAQELLFDRVTYDWVID